MSDTINPVNSDINKLESCRKRKQDKHRDDSSSSSSSSSMSSSSDSSNSKRRRRNKSKRHRKDKKLDRLFKEVNDLKNRLNNNEHNNEYRSYQTPSYIDDNVSRQLYEDNDCSDPEPQFSLAISTKLKDPEILQTPSSYLDILKNVQCFGDSQWRNVRYSDVQKNYRHFPGFSELEANEELKQYDNNRFLLNADKAYGSLSFALIKQKDVLEKELRSFLLWVKTSPDLSFIEINNKIQDIFVTGDFSKISNDALQLVCGHRAEIIQQRRESILASVKDPLHKNTLRSIPPSCQNLFEAEKLSLVLDKAGGVRKVFWQRTRDRASVPQTDRQNIAPRMAQQQNSFASVSRRGGHSQVSRATPNKPFRGRGRQITTQRQGESTYEYRHERKNSPPSHRDRRVSGMDDKLRQVGFGSQEDYRILRHSMGPMAKSKNASKRETSKIIFVNKQCDKKTKNEYKRNSKPYWTNEFCQFHYSAGQAKLSAASEISNNISKMGSKEFQTEQRITSRTSVVASAPSRLLRNSRASSDPLHGHRCFRPRLGSEDKQPSSPECIEDGTGDMEMWGWNEQLKGWSPEQRKLLMDSWRPSTLKSYKTAWSRWVPHDEYDAAMDELLGLAHEFLQHFCHGNIQNQAILHKHLDLFLNAGVRTGY
ncbi:unnamed protein product [Danaus chrysippus]|uniref:(African queen) hypothetical protein n=1 Tax=Danaus chrysippus TaxID=151541 RepID=A0A8J2QGE3_9NEOP|nr:unnamed protein product [Danaus chrysippus]